MQYSIVNSIDGKITSCCYVCGGSHIEPYREIEGFVICRCKMCNLKWVGNPPSLSGLEYYYGKDYYSSNSKVGYQNYLTEEKNHRRNARRLLQFASIYQTIVGSCLLDYGCGFGFLLDEARKYYDCKCHGVEISHVAGEYAKEILGLNVNGDIALENFPPDFFNVAFLIGTIEHLPNPKEVLQAIAKVLKRSGHLIITTLDTKGLLPLYSLKPPEHLFYFSHDNFTQLLEQTGFLTVTWRTYFVNYSFFDLVYRVGKYLSMELLCTMSKSISRIFPNLSLQIPTNEMIVIAQRINSDV